MRQVDFMNKCYHGNMYNECIIVGGQSSTSTFSSKWILHKCQHNERQQSHDNMKKHESTGNVA